MRKYAALHPRFMKDVVQTVQFGRAAPKKLIAL